MALSDAIKFSIAFSKRRNSPETTNQWSNKQPEICTLSLNVVPFHRLACLCSIFFLFTLCLQFSFCINNNKMKGLPTECVTDLDSRLEMLIFESILTTFELSVILKAAGALLEIVSSLRISSRNQVKLAQIRETHCRF